MDDHLARHLEPVSAFDQKPRLIEPPIGDTRRDEQSDRYRRLLGGQDE